MKLSRIGLKLLYHINERNVSNSKSQILQDIFVLNELEYKRNGYFVEIFEFDKT